MARIVVAGYMVRYPLGGMLSNTLEYLVALQRLGHEVSFVERAGYPNSCWDPARNVMSDDATYGLEVVGGLLARFGVTRWCYEDAVGTLYGPCAGRLDALFRGSDVFIDYGAHGTWSAEAAAARTTVLIDGEPGFNQIKFEKRMADGETLPVYDHYFTNGLNLGTERSPAPTAGLSWKHLFHPVNVSLHEVVTMPRTARFTTVMNWQSHARIEHAGTVYGQKDLEFERFWDLPQRRPEPDLFRLAVSGPSVPGAALRSSGWQVVDGHAATRSYESFLEFIDGSTGEFSVCKNIFVALNTGWFSDRSAVYLARGRPVIMQDTGFSAHLPVGEGLFAVNDLDDACAAVDAVLSRPHFHSNAARELAREHLDGTVVMGGVLDAIS